MRRVIVCLSVIILCRIVPAYAATATPTPSPTPTPTATPTITPTFELNTFLTVIPPDGGLSDAHAGAVRYEINAGDAMIAILLFALLALSLFIFFYEFRRRAR